MEYATHRQPPQAWVQWMDEWVRDMRFQGLSANTREHWWYQISDFAKHIGKPPQRIGTGDMETWMSRSGISNAEMRGERNAFSSFFRWAKRKNKRADNPVEQLSHIKRESRKKLPAPETAVQQGLAQHDKRLRLMVGLAADAGLRRSEIAIVHTDDLIDSRQSDGQRGKSLIVHGKGAKDRIVPLTPQLVDDILSSSPGWLFPGDCGGHVCPDTVYRIIRKATGFPTHSMRRRFATVAYNESGCNIVAIQELLGHESLATTQAYITVTPAVLCDVIECLSKYERTSHIELKSQSVAVCAGQ